MLYNVLVMPRRLFKNRDKNLNKPNQIRRIKPLATIIAHLNKTSDRVLHLVKEIGDINKIDQENYFLYDDSDMTETTFFNELNKKIQKCGLISCFSDNKKKYCKTNNSPKTFQIYGKIKKV